MRIKCILKKIYTPIALFSIAFTLPIETFAWSYTGHVLIAQIAYDNLTPSEQVRANSLTQNIFYQLSLSQQQELNTKYYSASSFAKMALLPDVWKNWKLETLFQHYMAPLPQNLSPYAKYSTKTWHYVDNAYPNMQICSLPKPNITTILPLLETDLTLAKANIDSAQAMHQKEIAMNQAGLTLILVSHLVGDSHQPLHTFGKTNTYCQSDKGGNNFCLKLSKSGKCSKNLHQLWDNGVGFIKPKMNIEQTAYKLEHRYPINSFDAKLLTNTNSLEWTTENMSLAPFVYDISPNQPIKSDYYKEGQDMATRQLALAGYRLAYILKKSGLLN